MKMMLVLFLKLKMMCLMFKWIVFWMKKIMMLLMLMRMKVRKSWRDKLEKREWFSGRGKFKRLFWLSFVKRLG